MYTIGMIHLGALISAPEYENNFNQVLNNALYELDILEKSGFDAAIVENFNDYPYVVEQSLETILQYTRILSVLREKTTLKLGVNIQYTNTDVEMLVASICDADFIRVENFVEKRIGAFGELVPLSSKIVRTKTRMKSSVEIYADINPKHTFNAYEQNNKYSIDEALNAGAKYLVLTGLVTGESPKINDVIQMKKISQKAKIIVGSGITINNVVDFKGLADGIIVGSSIKVDGDVRNLLDQKKCIDLIRRIKND